MKRRLFTFALAALTIGLLGSCSKINERIDGLDKRVYDLENNKIASIEQMIQSVSITPAYSDGSVEAVDGILTLKCIVSPAEALIGMESLKDSLLIYADSVKVKTKATTPAYMTIEVSEASVLDAAQGAITLKADISKYLPKGEGKALTVAVNIKNGISDFTTEFVPVYVYVAPAPVAPEGFVDLGVKDANGKPLFWAECNLGASNPQDYGDYFAWGETAPYYTTTGGWPATPTWKSGKASGYAWQSYCGQSSFVEWSTPPYDATSNILKPEFDAATAANSSWRTPTKDEFVALAASCVWWRTDNYNGTGKAGYIVYKAKKEEDKGKANMNGTWKKWDVSQSGYVTDGASEATGYTTSDTHIFFPAAGDGFNTSLFDAGSTGYYWSSSLYTDGTDRAYRLYLTSKGVYPQSYFGRYYGFSVRPVTSGAAPAPAPLPDGALKGVFSVSADKKVRFSKGNLQYVVAGKTWGFYENQYDFCNAKTYPGHHSDTISLFTWGYDATKSIIPDGKDSDNVSITSGNLPPEQDWGCTVGDGKTWRTLTAEEWQYLFSDKSRYGFATVGGVNGIIILPDTFADPMRNGGSGAFKPNKTGYGTNVYTTGGNWEAMESAGAVFLSAAGYRNGSSIDNYIGFAGYYWSSTARSGGINAFDVTFNEYQVIANSFTNGRSYGKSVRLVTEVK